MLAIKSVLQNKQQLCRLSRLLAHPFAPDSFDHAGKSHFPKIITAHLILSRLLRTSSTDASN
jgi:hypothetical protein